MDGRAGWEGREKGFESSNRARSWRTYLFTGVFRRVTIYNIYIYIARRPDGTADNGGRWWRGVYRFRKPN